MIYPIYIYGQSVLRKVAEDISTDYPNLDTLIEDMFATMFHANGIGLAAPQIGLSIRVITIGLDALADDFPEYKNFKHAYINPHIVETAGDMITSDEGCLSLPGISESVKRPTRIRITYLDEQFIAHDEWVEGYLARVLQHEIDHLEGHVFVDRILPIRRQLLRSKLTNMTKGKVKCSYKTK